MRRVLIIDEMHPSIIPLLEEAGFIPDYQPLITEKEVIEKIEQYTGLLVRSKIFIDKPILEKAKNLRFIARAGAGMDQIVEDEVRLRNILLVNAPEGNRDAVAEHMIGMLLALMNNLLVADQQIRNGIWLREENRGFEVGGKTVAIIGYGNNGKAFAKKIKGFDCEILAYDIAHHGGDENATLSDMATIYEKADIISFHVPLTDITNRMVNKAYLNKFRKKIWLLNASRGQVVVLNDLVEAIDEGKIYGAGLDVLENEKLDKFKKEDQDTYSALINHKKILLSPHVAGWTHESYVKINQVLVQKIKALKI